MKVIRLEGKLYLRKPVPVEEQQVSGWGARVCSTCAFQGMSACNYTKCSTGTKEFIFVEVQEVPKHAQV